MKFDESFDVIVAGFGHGGAISAITAADHGAKTLILEKSSVPGGLSICSYGAVRSARDVEGAFAYLEATNGGRTPSEVNRALAQGMCEMEAYVRELATYDLIETIAIHQAEGAILMAKDILRECGRGVKK